MTEKQLKKLLSQFNATQIEISLLEECSRLSKNTSEDLLYHGNIQFRIIRETLNILNRNERFIIENHLICHHTWSETTILFAKETGAKGERSERTLKRIQSRALKKMVSFINNSQLKEYFHEM